MDNAFQPLTELSKGLDDGRLTSAELVSGFLSRIEKHDEKLHAFVTVYADEALSLAAAADKQRAAGYRLGPLHGIPIAMKDIVDMKSRVTTGGSKSWTGRVSPVTATLVQKLIQAGMIVIGKTHTVEFAMGGWGTNTHMGTPWNPWDLEMHRTPGGSSAGSGVSVAAGLAPCAVGTDTGGSVRLPAAWCGLTGLKTTIGRISTYGVLPLSTTLDTPGPMTRTVEDATLLYLAMAGPDPLDPQTLRRPVEDPLPSLRKGVAGLRLGVLQPDDRACIDADILSAYDASLATFERLGAVLVPTDIPVSFNKMAAITGMIIGCQGYSFVGDLVDDMDQPIDPDVRPRIWLGKNVTARRYIETLREKESIKAQFNAAWKGLDAFLTPTVATPAVPLTNVDQSGTPAGFTRIVNLLDRCAVAVPNGFTPDGLPASLQIICDGYAEAMALRIGWAYENATDWTCRTPPGLGG